MFSKQNYQGNWKRFIIFTLTIGLLVGLFSVKSDHLPYFGGDTDIPIFEIILSYLAVMINSLPMWFIVAMIVGYLFGRNIKESMLFGAVYTVIAITFYFVLGDFFTDVSIPSLSFIEQIRSKAIWYGASLVGGLLGGAAGFLLQKTPYILLILPVGIIFQLFLYGPSSWSNIIGIAQNVTFCLMIIGIAGYLITVKIKSRK